MPLPRLVRSLKAKLLLGGVAALVVGITLTVLALLMVAERRLLLERRQAELGHAQRQATLLEQRLATFHRALAAASGRLTAAHLADQAAQTALLESLPVLREMFASVYIADTAGQVLVVHDERGYRRPGVYVTDRSYFQRALQGGYSISEPIVGRISGQPLVLLAQPVIIDGHVAAVLGGSLILASGELLGGIADPVKGDDDQLVVVTDAQGRILAHPDAKLLAESIAAEPRLAAASQRLATSGAAPGAAGVDLSSDEDLVTVVGIASAEWRVWRHRSREAVLAPLAAGRRDVLLGAALLVLVLSGVLALSLGWLLHPLQELQRRAHRLFDGDLLPDEGWPSGNDEIGRLAAVLRQVGSERLQREATQRDLVRRLETVMTAAPVGILFTRAQRFELVSDEFCRLLKQDRSRLVGQLTETVFASAEDYRQLGPAVGQAFSAGRPYDADCAMQRADGSQFWTRLRGLPVDAQDAGAGTVWTVQDITQDMAARRALEWAAMHDPLTGLANRKTFYERVAQVFGAQPQSHPAALLLLDLDHFKPVNDAHGHAAGDAVLRGAAQAIAGQVRAGDLVARLGGDEFGVLLERCPAEVALRVAETVRIALAGLQMPWHGQALQVGVSVGVAALDDQPFASAAEWIAAADRASYDAKAAGRNLVRRAQARRLQLVHG